MRLVERWFFEAWLNAKGGATQCPPFSQCALKNEKLRKKKDNYGGFVKTSELFTAL